MKIIVAIVRPSKVEEIKDALSGLKISGMTISEVRGHGRQKGHTAIYRGKEYSVSLLPKMKVEIVLPDELGKKQSRPSSRPPGPERSETVVSLCCPRSKPTTFEPGKGMFHEVPS